MRCDEVIPVSDSISRRNNDVFKVFSIRTHTLSNMSPPCLIAGYTVWSHNLVAISRLRGSSLRVLTVTDECIDCDLDQPVYLEGDPIENMLKEVSLGLGRAWHPCLDYSVVLIEPTQHFHQELHAFSMGI